VRRLAAVIDDLAGDDLAAVDDAVLADDLIESERQLARLQAEQARRIAEFDRRSLAGRDGASSTAAWLRWKTRCGVGAARWRVRTARRLETLPATRAGLAAGIFGWEQAAAIAAAMTEVRAEFAADGEAILAGAAARVDARRLRGVIRAWTAAADDAALLADANAAHAARHATLSTTMNGTGVLNVTTDAEGAETLAVALHAAARRARRPGDGLTAGQRRHDALIDIARSYLDSRDDLATISGARPHLQVRVDLTTLARLRPPGLPPGRSGVTTGPPVEPAELAELAELAEFDWAGTICDVTARRLACDAALVRMVTAGASMPLDVGRATDTVHVGLRRAVIARDRHCVFPGCDRHARYCDAHHLTHWADGGPTSLPNLALLCRYHHRLVHEGGWTLSRTPDHTWTSHRPGERRSPDHHNQAVPAATSAASAAAKPTPCHHRRRQRQPTVATVDTVASEARPAYRTAYRITARVAAEPPDPRPPTTTHPQPTRPRGPDHSRASSRLSARPSCARASPQPT